MIHKFDWTQMIDRSIVCLFFSINRLIDWLNQWIKLTFGCWLVRWPCRLWVGRRLSLWKARSARKRWEEFWRKILSSLWRSAPSGLPRQSLTRAHRFPIQKSNCCKNLICIFRLLPLISIGLGLGSILEISSVRFIAAPTTYHSERESCYQIRRTIKTKNADQIVSHEEPERESDGRTDRQQFIKSMIKRASIESKQRLAFHL